MESKNQILSLAKLFADSSLISCFILSFQTLSRCKGILSMMMMISFPQTILNCPQQSIPVELLRHLKRISGSRVLVCLLLNSFAVYSVVTDSKVLKLSIKIREIDGRLWLKSAVAGSLTSQKHCIFKKTSLVSLFSM